MLYCGIGGQMRLQRRKRRRREGGGGGGGGEEEDEEESAAVEAARPSKVSISLRAPSGAELEVQRERAQTALRALPQDVALP
jgi:hypothetical protein